MQFVTNLEKTESENSDQKDFVSLTTIHQAKGLEWPLVVKYQFVRLCVDCMYLLNQNTNELLFDNGVDGGK